MKPQHWRPSRFFLLSKLSQSKYYQEKLLRSPVKSKAPASAYVTQVSGRNKLALEVAAAKKTGIARLLDQAEAPAHDLKVAEHYEARHLY